MVSVLPHHRDKGYERNIKTSVTWLHPAQTAQASQFLYPLSFHIYDSHKRCLKIDMTLCWQQNIEELKLRDETNSDG